MIDTEYDYKLVVYGSPRATSAGGFVRVYDDPNSAKEKRKLAVVIQEQAPKRLLDCPLRVDLYFYLPRPKGHYGTGKNAEERLRAVDTAVPVKEARQGQLSLLENVK